MSIDEKVPPAYRNLGKAAAKAPATDQPHNHNKLMLVDRDEYLRLQKIEWCVKERGIDLTAKDQPDGCREAFEKWAVEHRCFALRNFMPEGRYPDDMAQHYWECWQAAWTPHMSNGLAIALDEFKRQEITEPEGMEPCPFCIPERSRSHVIKDCPDHFFARCMCCWAKGPVCVSEAKAVETWNTRPERELSREEQEAEHVGWTHAHYGKQAADEVAAIYAAGKAAREQTRKA